MGLRTDGFNVGGTTLKDPSSKVFKHEKACPDNAFIPFAFDTFGFLALEIIDLLQRVQMLMNKNVISPRSMNVVFKRIGFDIRKGVAAQLVTCLPFIYV